MPLSQRLGERRAEQLIPGGTLGPVSWGWWRFPASHQAHLASVQAALEGAGLGLHAWSCHRSPGNPLLAAPCSERSPPPPGLAPPRPGGVPSAQALCPWEPPQVRPGSSASAHTALSAHTSLSSHPPLPLRFYPGWCLFFRSRLQSRLPAPFTQASRQGEPSHPCVPASAPVYFWAVGFTFSFIP